MKKTRFISLLLSLIFTFMVSTEARITTTMERMQQIGEKIETYIMVSTEARITTTMERMQQIGEKIETYIMEKGCVPQVTSMKELGALLDLHRSEGDNISLKDAWGQPFHYNGTNITLKDGRVDSRYWLGSGGNDCFDGFLKYITRTGTTQGDIVFSNGTFVTPSLTETTV